MPAQSTATEALPFPLGVVTDAQTYRNLAYILSRFPLGIAYFSIFLTGIVLGATLTPFVVGIPILGFVLGFATYVGMFEASLARRLLGIEVSYDPLNPSEVAIVPYLKQAFTDPRNYLLVAYFFATFGIGIGSFVAVTVLLTMAVVLAVAPLTYWLPWTQYRVASIGSEGIVVIDTLPEALVASVVGIALLIVALYVFNALARGLGLLTRVLLS